MPLPDLIEIVPLTQPVRAEITVPGSKSITNRALVLAALAEGEVALQGALCSEDTQIMVEALRKLGFRIKAEPDPEEFCNRTITVRGLAGRIPNGGTAEKPLELFVGNAGTVARFLAAMVCLGEGVYRLHGVPRMHERPQAALFAALRELGYRVDSPNDKMPAVIFGSGPRSGREVSPENIPVVNVSVAESSQFASALLLCSDAGGWRVNWVDANDEEVPYVEMTARLAMEFPFQGGRFQIEGDSSSGSYIWAALNLVNKKAEPKMFANWPTSLLQIDSEFSTEFEYMIAGKKRSFSRRDDLGDSMLTLIVLAPFANSEIRFTDLGRLRVQECERVVALRTELTKCGAKVV